MPHPLSRVRRRRINRNDRRSVRETSWFKNPAAQREAEEERDSLIIGLEHASKARQRLNSLRPGFQNIPGSRAGPC
jgi:DNA-binding TFAR19-related protein (PDSD5 family)